MVLMPTGCLLNYSLEIHMKNKKLGTVCQLRALQSHSRGQRELGHFRASDILTLVHDNLQSKEPNDRQLAYTRVRCAPACSTIQGLEI